MEDLGGDLLDGELIVTCDLRQECVGGLGDVDAEDAVGDVGVIVDDGRDARLGDLEPVRASPGAKYMSPRATVRIALMTSSPDWLLSANPSAPAASALATFTSSSNVVRTRTASVRRRISRVA